VEGYTIRVGTTQASAYMAGIYGNQPSGALPVVVNSNGQLGTTTQQSVVTSWNGRTGDVVPQTGDYSFSLVSGTLASSQLSGTYSNALTLSNTSNVFVGNGSGLTGVLPAAGSPYYIQNGTTQQAETSFNIAGNGTLGGNLAASVINAAASYQIGGSNALSSPASNNLFVGLGAGSHNIGGNNTFVGTNAGISNINGQGNSFLGASAGLDNLTGSRNTIFGSGAGVSNTEGSDNTFIGYDAGTITTNSANTFVGSLAGSSNNGGFDNTFTGYQAGSSNTSGSGNTFYGFGVGSNNTVGTNNTFVGGGAAGQNLSGGDNTFVGTGAGSSNLDGSANTFLGISAGSNNLTGSFDIYIGNSGPSSQNESNTIRIGTEGSGNGQQSAAYIAGIYGSTIGGNGVAVYVDSNGQLGTTVSSRRFKEQIRDMGDSSSALMKLRPVTFLYKPEYDKGQRTLQYGLIAEEVAGVYPDLVAYDPHGKPYTVKYQYLTTMLLNEVQKQYHQAEAEAEVIKSQEQRISELEQRLSRLEGVVETSLRISENKTACVPEGDMAQPHQPFQH
jgi:hypothetical protein